MKFGRPGCADILAMPHSYIGKPDLDLPIWFEVKAQRGVQSEIQREFQLEVEDQGHRYAVVRSIDDVAAVLEHRA